MAEIVENLHGRRMIRMSTDDVITVIKEYQNAVCGITAYSDVRSILDEKDFYLPEDL